MKNGSTITDLRYESHKIINGKPELEGLPATYVENEDEAQTLEITLIDSLIGLKAILSYTTYENYDAIIDNCSLGDWVVDKKKLLKSK